MRQQLRNVEKTVFLYGFARLVVEEFALLALGEGVLSYALVGEGIVVVAYVYVAHTVNNTHLIVSL